MGLFNWRLASFWLQIPPGSPEPLCVCSEWRYSNVPLIKVGTFSLLWHSMKAGHFLLGLSIYQKGFFPSNSSYFWNITKSSPPPTTVNSCQRWNWVSPVSTDLAAPHSEDGELGGWWRASLGLEVTMDVSMAQGEKGSSEKLLAQGTGDWDPEAELVWGLGDHVKRRGWVVWRE